MDIKNINKCEESILQSNIRLNAGQSNEYPLHFYGGVDTSIAPNSSQLWVSSQI